MSNRIRNLIGWCVVGLAVVCGIVWAADEITFNSSINVNNGNLQMERKPGSQLIDMSGDALSDNVQVFTVTDTNLITITAGVSTYGVAWFRNLTASTGTNGFIEIGYSPDVGTNFYPTLRLEVGEYTACHLSPNVILYATATTNSQTLRTIIVED